MSKKKRLALYYGIIKLNDSSTNPASRTKVSHNIFCGNHFQSKASISLKIFLCTNSALETEEGLPGNHQTAPHR